MLAGIELSLSKRARSAARERHDPVWGQAAAGVVRADQFRLHGPANVLAAHLWARSNAGRRPAFRAHQVELLVVVPRFFSRSYDGWEWREAPLPAR